MKNIFSPKEFLNIKILSSSEEIAIKGGKNQKQKWDKKRKSEIKDRVTTDDDVFENSNQHIF